MQLSSTMTLPLRQQTNFLRHFLTLLYWDELVYCGSPIGHQWMEGGQGVDQSFH